MRKTMAVLAVAVIAAPAMAKQPPMKYDWNLLDLKEGVCRSAASNPEPQFHSPAAYNSYVRDRFGSDDLEVNKDDHGWIGSVAISYNDEHGQSVTVPFFSSYTICTLFRDQMMQNGLLTGPDLK